MGRRSALLAAALVAVGCTRQCVPAPLSKSSNLIDLSAPDAHAPVPAGFVTDVAAEFQRRGAAAHPPGVAPYHVLALSGGGLYGAFGIGLLNGWTESGSRPAFDVVTGISTGALIATFAFLGPQYDQLMREKMVGVRQSQLFRRRPIILLPLSGAVYSNRPLARQTEELLTDELLAEVGAAHRAGRRLYIGTTNIDTRGLVIWDMGEIAARGTPGDYALYRQVVLASCAVPGALPAARIPVEIDGKKYDELHVDGGASDQAIFRAFMVADRNRLAGVPGAVAPPGSNLYVVNHGKLYADPDCVRHGAVPLLVASYRSLIYGKSRDEFYRMYLNCLETGMGFRLTAIPQDYPVGAEALGLDRETQWGLYEQGVRAGREAGGGGALWRDRPTGIIPAEQALPRAGTKFATRRDRACGGPR